MVSPQHIAARIRQWETQGPQGPITLEIYPTLRCNLNCQFCDTTERHQPPIHELSTQRWLDIIDEAQAMGVKQVYVLGGGEPLARPDTPELLERIKSHNLYGMLTTNGTLLSAQLSADLIRWGWDEIHFSIDGPTATIHDLLRGKSGAFRKTVRTICRMAQQKRRMGIEKPELVIHTVLTNKNMDVLPDFFNLAHALSVSRVDIDELIAYRPEQEQLQLSPEQRIRLPEVAKQSATLAEKYGIQHRLEPFIQAKKTIRGEQIPIPTGQGLKAAPCLKAWHHLVVQADGKISPCCVLSGQGGDARKQPLPLLWNTDPFLKKIRFGMANKSPTKRCSECSWNILSHEANIRAEL